MFSSDLAFRYIQKKTNNIDKTRIHEIKKDSKKHNQYTIYPNPSKDIVNIELNSTDTHKQGKTSGELFDIFGISKSKVEIKDGKAMFSVKGLQKGIYILKICINEKVESHKIAVE